MTAPITPAQLDELEGLEREATTDGPYFVEPHDWAPFGAHRIIPIDAYERRRQQQCSARPNYTALVFSGDDAAYFARLLNAAPSLFSALRAAWTRVEELERGLERVRDNGTEYGGKCASGCDWLAIDALRERR